MAGVNSNNEGGGVRDRFYYSNPVPDTQPHEPIIPGVRINNNPNINFAPKININTQKGTQCFTLVGVALLFIIVMAGLASFYSDNDDTVPADIASNIVQDNDEKSNTPNDQAKTPILMENSETVIANKLTEVSDMTSFAGCLKIKDSKATVDQFSKQYKNSIPEIRIEIMDVWLKGAEMRYWEELVEALKCIGNDRLAAQIADDFIHKN